MKKLLIILTIFIFSVPAFALENLCPSTYELAGGLKRFTSNISGENLIYTKLLENALEKQAKKELGGEIKIKIKSFSAQDLKEGKFSSANLIGENVSIRELDISKIELKSICSFNQIKKGTSAYNFVTDFPANVKIELSADNLNKITNTTDYKKALKEINSNLNGFLEIKNITFEIEDNKLVYNIDYITPFSSHIRPIKIKTDINYKNGESYVVNTQTSNHKSVLRYLLLNNALNYINPLDFSAKILENNTIETDVSEVYISDGKIIINAVMNIRK